MSGWNPSSPSRVLPLSLIWESLQLYIRGSSFSPFCVFSWEVFLFIVATIYLFWDSFVCSSTFSTFFISHTYTYSFPCGLSASQPVHIRGWKSSNIPLIGFCVSMCVCVCFHTKLLRYFEAFRGLFSNFFSGALAYRSLLSWERGSQSEPMHVYRETKAKKEESSVISKPSNNPYLEDQMSPAVDSSSSPPTRKESFILLV